MPSFFFALAGLKCFHAKRKNKIFWTVWQEKYTEVAGKFS